MATLVTTALPGGTHLVRAVYLGDADYGTATSAPVSHQRINYTSPCVTGTRAGPLTVAAGQAACIGAGGNQTGPVIVSPGGALDVRGGRITGPVTVTGAAAVRICGATITGSLTITGSTGPVLLGGPSPNGPCAPNTIVGPVTLTGNTGGVQMIGAMVTGPVQVRYEQRRHDRDRQHDHRVAQRHRQYRIGDRYAQHGPRAFDPPVR